MRRCCLGYNITGLTFLSEFKAAAEVLPEGPLLIAPGGLIKGAFFLDLPRWENEKQSVSIKLVVPWRHMCLLWSWGRFRWKDLCCWAAFTEIRSRYIHAVTYTRGRKDFPLGMASLQVSSSSPAPLGPSSSPSAFGSADSLEVSSCSLAWAI